MCEQKKKKKRIRKKKVNIRYSCRFFEKSVDESFFETSVSYYIISFRRFVLSKAILFTSSNKLPVLEEEFNPHNSSSHHTDWLFEFVVLVECVRLISKVSFFLGLVIFK